MIENRIPISATLEPADRAAAPWVRRDSSAEPIDVRGLRILLVDDEEPLRACVRLMLEFDGHHVTEATNGAEALRLFNSGVFDLVITDFEMPRMKGNELALAIKVSSPSLPILMITASERARREPENPVDALMNKPFTVTELHAALEKLLSTRSASAQSATVPSLGTPSASLVPEPQAVPHL